LPQADDISAMEFYSIPPWVEEEDLKGPYTCFNSFARIAREHIDQLLSGHYLSCN